MRNNDNKETINMNSLNTTEMTFDMGPLWAERTEKMNMTKLIGNRQQEAF